jgi:hypothetical protein
LTAAVLAIAIGCGGGGSNLGVSVSDRLEVTKDIERAPFNFSYGEDRVNITHHDRWDGDIPAGTVLEVFVNPRAGASTITVQIVQAMVERTNAEGEVEQVQSDDARELRRHFVPDRFRTADLQYYTISLDTALLGSQARLKKLE